MSAQSPAGHAPPDGTGAPCCCGPGPSGRRPGPPGPPGPALRRPPSWTERTGGRRSSAKPPPPRTTSGPEPWKAGPRAAPARPRAAGRARPAPGAAGPGRRRPARRSAASTMDCQPVQRHRWASSAASTSRRVGGVPARRPSRAARRMTMPGVQKPHWLAPAATKAATQRSRERRRRTLEGGHRRPATRRTGVTQATRGAPSTHTVQQPHWPWGLQPSLTERHPSSSRSASRREIPSLTDDLGPVRATKTTARTGRRAGSAAMRCGSVPDRSGGRARSGGAQLKEEPQPQVRVALGFVMWNPAPCSPSL